MRSANPTAAPPATVRLAAMLLLAVTGVLVVRAVLTYLWFDDLIDWYIEWRGLERLPREVAADFAPGYRSFALVNVLVFGTALAVLAVFVLRGAGWARIAATVVGVLGLLGGVLSVVQPATIPFRMLGALVALGLAAAVVLLWMPASSAFVRGRR